MITIKYNLVPGSTQSGLLLLVVVQCRVGRLMVGVGGAARTRCITSESSNTWGGVRRGGRHLPSGPGHCPVSTLHTTVTGSTTSHHIVTSQFTVVLLVTILVTWTHHQTFYIVITKWHGPHLSIFCNSFTSSDIGDNVCGKCLRLRQQDRHQTGNVWQVPAMGPGHLRGLGKNQNNHFEKGNQNWGRNNSSLAQLSHIFMIFWNVCSSWQFANIVKL